MKGVVFNLFEDFIVQTFGDAAWEAILEKSPHDARGVKVGPGTYPDGHLFAMVGAACEVSGLPVDTAVRAFGKFLFGGLARKYPAVAGRFPDAVSMLTGIDSVIHVEVNKLLPGAVTPTILCSEDAQGLVLRYSSSRSLCTLMEGLLDGMAEHFKVDLQWTHDVCCKRGAAACELRLTLGAQRQVA